MEPIRDNSCVNTVHPPVFLAHPVLHAKEPCYTKHYSAHTQHPIYITHLTGVKQTNRQTSKHTLTQTCKGEGAEKTLQTHNKKNAKRATHYLQFDT